MLGWALTGIFHTSPVSSHQLHPSSHLAGARLEREQRGAGAAGRCRRAPLLLSTKIDAAQLRALPEQLLALPRSLLLFFLSIKRRRSSSGPLLPRVGELCRQGDADPAAQDAATRPLRGANPTPELGGSDCSAPSPSAALFSAATTALARCTQHWAPAVPVPLFWKDFFVICNIAGCRGGASRWGSVAVAGMLGVLVDGDVPKAQGPRCLQGLQAPWCPTARAKTSPWHGDVFVPPRQEGCSQCPCRCLGMLSPLLPS